MKKQLICGLSILMAGALLAGCTGKGGNQPANSGVSENPDSQTQVAEAASSDSAYSILVVDENDNPVSGVIVQFCTDTMCNLGETGGDGIAVFEADKPGAYTVHIQGVPDGFAEDETEYVTEEAFGQLKLVLKSAAGAGDETHTYTLKETGVEITLPEKMQNTKGTLSLAEFAEEDGLAFARLDYLGRSKEEIAEFDRRYEEATDNRDNEELLNDFLAYMDDYYNTIDTVVFVIFSTKNGDSIEDILNRNPDPDVDVKIKDYVTETLDLGKKGDYQYYLLKIDRDRFNAIAYASEDEMPKAEKEIADEFAVIDGIDINEFAKGIKLIDVQPVKAVEVGDKIEFEAKDFDGNAVSSKDLFADHKLTLVNCWATWCHWCVEELPDLEAYNTELEGQGCQIIGICQDGVKKSDKAKDQIKEAGVTYTNVVLDDFDAVLPKVSSFPTTYIVDSEGVVVNIIVGANFNGYVEGVDEALKNVK